MQLSALALKPTMFVHFLHPATGELVHEPFPAVYPEGHELAGQPHPKAGQPDLDKPVGVRVFGPGSKEYRAAQTALTNEAIERKRKKVTAELIEANAVELLARVTSEYVGFEYEGQGASLETNRKFYRDERFVHFREQVQSEMGDHGNFLPSA